jgi:hypothetical protein
MPIMPSAHISAKAAALRSGDVAQVTQPALWDPTIAPTAPTRVPPTPPGPSPACPHIKSAIGEDLEGFYHSAGTTAHTVGYLLPL